MTYGFSGSTVEAQHVGKAVQVDSLVSDTWQEINKRNLKAMLWHIRKVDMWPWNDRWEHSWLRVVRWLALRSKVSSSTYVITHA